MKKTAVFQLAVGLLILSLYTLPALSAAQDDAYPGSDERFSREELLQMLAPIALYPDALLAQILMASTYPIEVIEAERWMKTNAGLAGENWTPHCWTRNGIRV